MPNPSPFEFFEAFYPGTRPMGRLTLYTTTLRAATERNYWCFNLREVDRRCTKYRDTRRVLFCAALHNEEIALSIAKSRRRTAARPNIRGCEASVTALPALWVEIPYGDRASLPPSLRHALDLLQSIAQRPSIVLSGSGKLQAFWLLDRPWVFDLKDQQAADKAEAKALLRRLWWAVACLAAEHGWNVDATRAANLAAAFPVPESPTGASAKGPRTALETFPLVTGCERYSRFDFEPLPEPPTVTQRPWQEVLEPPDCIRPATQTHSLEPIARGCGWLGHCHTDRATLDKKELAHATRLLHKCYAPGADGAQLIHTLYSGHPGYERGDVDKKIAATLRKPAGPLTCLRISKAPGVLERYCSVCPHFGLIDTPYELAREDNALGDDQAAVSTPDDELRVRSSWPSLPDKAQIECALSKIAEPRAEFEAQAAELLAGLEALLASLGGAATARQITGALAADPERSPQLAAVLPCLIPDFDPGDPRAAIALGACFRGLKRRTFAGRALAETSRLRDGIAWAIRPASPAAPPPANNPKEEGTA